MTGQDRGGLPEALFNVSIAAVFFLRVGSYLVLQDWVGSKKHLRVSFVVCACCFLIYFPLDTSPPRNHFVSQPSGFVPGYGDNDGCLPQS